MIVIYGGRAYQDQIEFLEKGCDILISTPGRFIDLYLRGIIKVDTIKTLVIDEADRLFDTFENGVNNK